MEVSEGAMDDNCVELNDPPQPNEPTHTAREVELELHVSELEGRIAELTRQNQEMFVKFSGQPEPKPVDPKQKIKDSIRAEYMKRHRPAIDYFKKVMKGEGEE